MKNTMIFLVLLLCICTLTATKTHYPRFAAQTGISWSTFGKDSTDDTEYVMGYHIGGSYISDIPVPYLLVEPGIRLTINKGASKDLNGVEFSTHLSYLNILTKTKWDTGNLNIYPYIGLDMGILLSAENRIAGNGHKIVYDIKDDTSSIDFTFLYGLDYVIWNNISMGCEIGVGLSNVAKDTDYKIINRTIYINIGYLFQ